MRAPLLSASPAAHVGKTPGGVLPVALVLKTLYPALVKALYPVWAHNVATIFAHFPAALAGVSHIACTICTATLRMVDSPDYSTPSIDIPAGPAYYPPLFPVYGDAPGYPIPGPPIYYPCRQVLALEVVSHWYYYGTTPAMPMAPHPAQVILTWPLPRVCCPP